jgi:hypothetical protein
MVAQMALIAGKYWISIILSFVLPFTPIGLYVVPLLLIYMSILTVRIIPLSIAWFAGSYGNLLVQCIINILFSIFIYAILYFKAGLVVSGEHQSIDLATALYFSGTTWTTVGYGDISAPAELRLLTTVEALNGYLSMAILIALIGLWLNDALEAARKYNNWIENASKQDIEEVTGLNVDDLAEKVQNK